VHPLDGGALSHVGNALTGERAHGGAAVFSSRMLWAVNSLSSRFLGAREQGEKSRGKKGKDASGFGPGGAPRRAGREPHVVCRRRGAAG
jgi:hypothetical protein